MYQEPVPAQGKQPTPRGLGPFDLIGLGVGAIIGAGIFVLTGQVAARSAGPAVVVSFALAAVACAFAGLCYAEMAAAVTDAGSAYKYAEKSMGRFVGWIIGWDLVLEYALGACTVAIGWAGYAVSVLRDVGIALPAWTTTPINWPAVAVVAAVTTLLLFEVKLAARVNTFIVVVKLAVVAIFIIAGIGHVSTSHWGGHFIPPNQGQFGQFGLSGVFQGAGVVFFAFIGFDVVSGAAKDAANPQRDMPIGILGSLAICTILYMIVSFVLTGVVDYQKLNVAEPIALGIDAIGLSWLAPIIKLGILCGLTTVILSLMYGQPRILYSMANDGLLPPALGRVNPGTGSPRTATLITGLCVAAAAGLLPMGVAGELVSIGTLLAFAIVSAGVLVLRVTRPDLPRPFRAPWIAVTAPLGVVTSLALMAGLPRGTWIRLFSWLAIGLAIFVRQGRRRGTARPAAKPLEPA